MDDMDTYTPERIDTQLTELTRLVEAGHRAERLRATIIGIARTTYPGIYTQTRLAQLTGVTQQAVSKTLGAGRRAYTDRRDTPYLLGRLMALAIGLSEPDLGALDDTRAPDTAIALRDSGHADTTAITRLRELTATEATRLDGDLAERFTTALADLTGIDGDADLTDETQRTAAVEGYYAQRTVLKHGRF